MPQLNRRSLYACHALPKNRPALVLTRDAVIPHLDRVTVVPTQGRKRNIQSEVVLTPQRDDVSKECVLSCDNIVTVSKEVMGSYISSIDIPRMNEVRNALLFSFGFSIPPTWRKNS